MRFVQLKRVPPSVPANHQRFWEPMANHVKRTERHAQRIRTWMCMESVLVSVATKTRIVG